MILPQVDDPQRYRGLYVYDFGEWTAIGYTAEEVAILLEDPNYRGGKAYRIHRASPDGSMELQAVSPARFQAESGLFFYRGDPALAKTDFRELAAAADRDPPPCRARLSLTDRGEGATPRYVTALMYPAEYDPDISAWLLAVEYQGGDSAEGGASAVTTVLQEANNVLDRKQLWDAGSIQSRDAAEVLASTRRAVQR